MSFDTGLDPYYVLPDDYQVCFQSDEAFLDREGFTTTSVCSPTARSTTHPSSTCHRCRRASRDRSEDGSFVYVTFLAPSGDPKGRV